MSHDKLQLNHKIKTTLALLLLVILNPLALLAQTPTHIDPGYGDKEVSVFDNPGYLFIIIGFLVLVVIIYLLLRKRGNKNEEKTNY